MEFLLVGGNLKELCGRLGKSYPTLRKRLDALIAKVQEGAQPLRDRSDRRKRILDLMQQGKLTLEAAEEILNKLL